MLLFKYFQAIIFNKIEYKILNSAPHGVKQAIIAIWATLALSALSALIAKVLGISSKSEFISAIVVYALICIVPYKISNRSNPARYVYAVITCVSFLFMAAGVGDLNKVDFAVSVLLIPAEIFILYRLFQRDASEWFSMKQIA